jgi:hypothetical protein
MDGVACCIARFAPDAPANPCRHALSKARANWFEFKFLQAVKAGTSGTLGLVAELRPFVQRVSVLRTATDEALAPFALLSTSGTSVGEFVGTSAVAAALRFLRHVSSDIVRRRLASDWTNRMSKDSAYQALALATCRYPKRDRALIREAVVAEVARLKASLLPREPAPKGSSKLRKSRGQRPTPNVLLPVLFEVVKLELPASELQRPSLEDFIGSRCSPKVVGKTIKRCIQDARAKAGKAGIDRGIIDCWDRLEARVRPLKRTRRGTIQHDDEHDADARSEEPD